VNVERHDYKPAFILILPMRSSPSSKYVKAENRFEDKITIYCSFIDYHRSPLGAEVDRILDEELIKDESSLGIELFVL